MLPPTRLSSLVQTVLLCATLTAGCGDDDKGPEDSAIDVALEDGSIDSSPDPEDATEPGSPTVGAVFDCGRTGAGGLARGRDDDPLLRHDVDLAPYPDALCNDGTGAVFYHRPFVGSENENRWVIQLQGGGGCATPQDCANRWCRVETNFGMNTMTSNGTPEVGIDGKGILARRAENPHGDWNQVFVKFCSSDGWSGTARDLTFEASHPTREGDPQPYAIHFLGHRILEAVVGTLRGESGPLTYASDDPVVMPRLGDAEEVALVGASAGGIGVIKNLDWLADELSSAEVRSLIDSAFFPELADVDHTATIACAEGHCDYDAFARASHARSPHAAFLDASCVASHAGAEYLCADATHVLHDHLTTPFFVRMGLQDSQLFGNFVDAGFGIGGPGPVDLRTFATAVRTDLLELDALASSAEERADIAVSPGVYAPACEKHETLRSDAHSYDATVRSGGDDHFFMDVYRAWRTGGTPTIVATDNPIADFCPSM